MRTAHWMLAAAVAVALCGTVSRADIYLDCGTPTSPAQAGWTGISHEDNYYDGTELDLGGGVTAGFGDNYNLNAVDRGSAGIMSGLGLDDMVRDFVKVSDTQNVDRHKLLIKGLPDGDYEVAVYSFDYMYTDNTYGWNINGQIVAIGPATGHDNDPAYVSATVDVTLSSGAANNVIFVSTFDGADGNGSTMIAGEKRLLDGVVIVPEPATMSLLGLGFLGLGALRHRRR